MDSGLSDRLISEIKELARSHGIARVILFGSRARGDYRSTSDIDLAVSGGNTDAFAVDANEVLETLLRFDVINLDGAVQRPLREAIEREGLVIYEKV